jgi:formylglycine-generating enzyme required for sulfatase activity
MTARSALEVGGLLLASLSVVSCPFALGEPPELSVDQAAILAALSVGHGLSSDQLQAVEAIMLGSPRLGTGNPAITRHPMTPEQCHLLRAAASLVDQDPRAESICGGPFMAPLYDRTTEQPAQARTCIDQYEFPDLPCAYPVVWTRASEAAQLCQAVGKRLCDAHEWEGACAGALQPPDYRWYLREGRTDQETIRAMRAEHNAASEPQKSWSYGPVYQAGICAAGSVKTEGCNGGDWAACGSNTYPAGAFADCRSSLGVYDLNGNAAEHMNLPLDASQAASLGSTTLGHTEMKGSWFIWDSYRAHDDWCRWRAPYWHGSLVMDADSHRNYHLGFRCCKDR